ncbi:hypothetical protein Barb4_03234 [Bacteroidales bacterium Barb4]|nr:hypothetical protein Barb4_03234 [Bacteroidales bacterium Barb4]
MGEKTKSLGDKPKSLGSSGGHFIPDPDAFVAKVDAFVPLPYSSVSLPDGRIKKYIAKAEKTRDAFALTGNTLYIEKVIHLASLINASKSEALLTSNSQLLKKWIYQ